MTAARRLSILLAVLMAVQSSLGLAFRRQYHDVDWIAAMPVWGTLLVVTATAADLLLRHAGGAGGSDPADPAAV